MVLLNTGYVNGQSRQVFGQDSIFTDFFLTTCDFGAHAIHVKCHKVKCPIEGGVGARVRAAALPNPVWNSSSHGCLAEDPLTACM